MKSPLLMNPSMGKVPTLTNEREKTGVIVMSNIKNCILLLVTAVLVGPAMSATAEESITANTGVDLYNRYVWRGLDIAATPSIQPTLSLSYAGLEVGTWAAYTLSNEASESDEIDFWLSYTKEFEKGASISALVTDFYYPNAGTGFFNFNGHDAVVQDTIPDPGAHLLEIGLVLTGPESFPVTLSAYLNVHNDAGDNIYLQLDYPFNVNDTELGFFLGAAAGSEENPDYYGTDDLQVINLGITASREIRMSESFSLPLSVTFVLNPNAEISHVLVGISL